MGRWATSLRRPATSAPPARPLHRLYSWTHPQELISTKGAAMSAMTDKMSEAGSGRPPMKGGGTMQMEGVDRGVGIPAKGDCFRCATCGMEIEVTADCHCDDPSQ